MVFTKTNIKRMGRPPKTVEKRRMPEEFESVIRTGGRVKKAKKVFDPSENDHPRRRTRIQNATDLEHTKIKNESTEVPNTGLQTKVRKSYYQKKKDSQRLQDEFCSICLKKSLNLIHCQDCNLKVHFSCINTNYQNTKLLGIKWRCDECKSCAVCYENSETGPLITCTACVISYHYDCHVPNVYEDNNLNWMCTKCSPKIKQFKPAIIRSRRFTMCATKCPSELDIQNINMSDNVKINVPQQDDNNELKKNDDIQIDNNNDETQTVYQYCKKKLDEIPDVSKWSCDQLANFVKDFFPEESKVLREQEIDGTSLLLLARTDVIHGLKLKLGPAIRLYNFINILQTKRQDITATWIY